MTPSKTLITASLYILSPSQILITSLLPSKYPSILSSSLSPFYFFCLPDPSSSTSKPYISLFLPITTPSTFYTRQHSQMTSEYIKHCTPLDLVFLESEPPRSSDILVDESAFTFDDDGYKVYLFEGVVGVDDLGTGLTAVDEQNTGSSGEVEKIMGLIRDDDQIMGSIGSDDGIMGSMETDIDLTVIGDADGGDLIDEVEETEWDLPENKTIFDMLCVLLPDYRSLYPLVKREV